MLTSKVPKLASVGELDRDIVACEVALVTLNSGGHVFDSERESLSQKLSELLDLRLHYERDHSTILRFALRAAANAPGSTQPPRGSA